MRKLLLVSLLLGSTLCSAAISVVQTNSSSNSGFTVPLAASQAAGDTLILAMGVAQPIASGAITTGATSVTDGNGNAWTIIPASFQHFSGVTLAMGIEFAYVPSCVSGAATTVTIVWGGLTYQSFGIQEVNGIPNATTDLILGALGTTSTALSSGSGTPSTANEFASALTLVDSGVTITPGSGFTSYATPAQGEDEYQILTTTASVAGTFTISPASDTWAVSFVTFKAGTGAAIVPKGPLIGVGP